MPYSDTVSLQEFFDLDDTGPMTTLLLLQLCDSPLFGGSQRQEENELHDTNQTLHLLNVAENALSSCNQV